MKKYENLAQILKYKSFDSLLFNLDMGSSLACYLTFPDTIFKKENENTYCVSTLPFEKKHLRTRYHHYVENDVFVVYEPNFLLHTNNRGHIKEVEFHTRVIERCSFMEDLLDNPTSSIEKLLEICNISNKDYNKLLDIVIQNTTSSVPFLDKITMNDEAIEKLIRHVNIESDNIKDNETYYFKIR